MKLDGIRGAPWLYFGDFEGAQTGPSSVLDDVADFAIETTTQALGEKPDGVMIDILRYAFFSMNWAEIAESPQSLEETVKGGYYYNYSQKPATLRM